MIVHAHSVAYRVPAGLTPPRTILFDWTLVLVVVLLLSVSAFALIELGWQYGEAGGAAWEKIHPATLLSALLVALVAMTRGNPLLAVADALAAHPAIMAYLAGIALLIVHAMFVVGLPFTTFIDTFLAAALLFLLLRDIDDEMRHKLALIVHALFFANAAVGIAEFALNFRLTPLHIGQEILDAEWRSSALMGHPLSNALLTGSYMVLLLSGGARDLPVWMKPLAFLAAAAAMIVFGGRAATVLVLVFVLWNVVQRGTALLSGRPFNPRLVLVGLIGLPVLAGLVVALADAGFFQRFIERFIDDEGSASTRVEMFALVAHVSWSELLLGPDPAHIQSLMRHYGLDYGIESFWLSLFLTHGIIVSMMFFTALILFCWQIHKTVPPSLPVLLYFFAVASASTSLSSKTTGLAVLVLMILILLPRPRSEPAGRHGVAERGGPQRLTVA